MELQVPLMDAQAQGVLCLPGTSALPDTQSLIHQVPSRSHLVTFV